MAYNFDRAYELYIGTPTIETKIFTNTPKETTIENQYQRYYTDIDEGKAVKITNLQLRAKIQRTSKGDSASSDTTVFEVFGLSPATRKFAEQEGALIILKAGYKGAGELPIVYAGQIKSVSTVKNAPEVVTSIVAGDAYIPRKNSRISRFYSRTTPKSEIIRDLALSLQGVGEGIFAVSSAEGQFFNGGFSASGKTIDVLEKLCRSLGYEVIIENNRVYVRPKYLTRESKDFTKLSARALRVSSKQIKQGSGKMNDNVKDLSNSGTTKAGYKFNLFLDGRVRVSSFIDVVDGDFQGIYKIVGLTHELDWRGANWNTIVETEAFS